MTWIIVTDSSLCKFYEYQKKPSKITLLKEIEHPESRVKREDALTSDKPGQYKARDVAGGAYSPHMDPREVEIDKFAREIAKELDHGRTAQLYHQVIIIASPHMSGLLFQHLNKNVKELVINNIQKDLMHLREQELFDFIKDNTKYSDVKS